MKNYRKLILLLVWIGLLLLPWSAFAKTTVQHGIEVSITLSSDTATIGNEITASFGISGGSGVFTGIHGVWNIYDSHTKCSYQVGGASYNELAGSSSYIPRYGDKLYFQLEGKDSNGNPFLAFSDEIQIGGTAVYPNVDITLSTDKAILDQDISASFEVTGGSGTCSHIYGVWNVFDSATNCSYQFDSKSFETSSGDSAYTPTFGDYLYFQVEGQDSEGVPFLAYSEKVDIIGDADYPNVEIRLSSNRAVIGEEISAEFEITGGSGVYTDLYGVWNVYDGQTNCTYQPGGTEFEGSSGRSSFTPEFGNKLYFQVGGKDSKGVSILSHSDEIVITASYDPDELTDASVVTSGTSDSSDVSWVLYDDGMLEFSGTGIVPSLFQHSVVPSISETNDGYRLSVKNVVINDGITGIEQQAFNEFSNLVNISIPDSVKVLGPMAFYKCGNLTSVEIPEGVARIYDHTFQFCRKLASVTIPGTVIQIGDYAFSCCEKLQNVSIPEGVTSIGEETFGNCYDMTTVTLPHSITSIGDYAFLDCDSLGEVYYNGTEEDFGKIELGDGNGKLTGANFTYATPEDDLQELKPVTVEYAFVTETATIGQPFTVNYEIKGGSGQFEEIRYRMDEITECCCVNDDYQDGELSSAKGSFTVVPMSGESIDLLVSCKDKETGVLWCENYYWNMPCNPNPEIPVSINNISETIALNDSFSFDYSIGGNNEINSARAEVWVFARNDTHPDCVYQMALENRTGTVTYTPKAGEQLYIAIRGKDAEGNPFYVKTGRLAVNTENGYQPVTVEYAFPTEAATIGQPFTVNYEIKGGSGQFEEIRYRMEEITEHCCVNDDYTGGELSSAKGSFTVVPTSGESIDLVVICKDSETGIEWFENYYWDISCNPNPEVPVSINNVLATISLNRPFTFAYSIEDEEDIAEARVEVWSFARNDTYPDCMLNQPITNKTGSITYSPTAGSQLYIAIRGKDVKGKPFYVKTGRLTISANANTTAPVLMGDGDVNCYINMPGNGELFQGGDVWQDSQVINVWIQNAYYFANNFPGTEPSWTFRKVSGQTLEIDAEPKTYGSGVYASKYYRGELTELPDKTGESVYEVTCTWGDVKTVKTITIHCIDIEWPTGLVNIEGTVHTYVGAKLAFNPQIAPEGWQVPGYPQLRWGFDDEADEFAITVPTKKDQYTDPYLDINDRKDLRIIASGTYESTYVITSDRVSVGRLVTFEIDENPEWTFRLPEDIKTIEANAFEGIAAETVYIPDGCETIGADAFANSDISVIFIPASVETIGDNALPENVFIYTSANSPASIWAAGHGFADYQIVVCEK